MPKYWTPLFALTFAWSAFAPYDQLTWLLEAAPAAGLCALLGITARTLPLTPVSYGLLLALGLLILIGAHYSFGRVPAFEWLRAWLGGDRNNFDKLAHFFQGAAPAMVFRELLIREDAVKTGLWLVWIVFALCLALSAAYELVEWVAALTLGRQADDFLAIQGDPWDTQTDMVAASLGALTSLAALSRVQDRQLSLSVAEANSRPAARNGSRPER
jgi:putative membrane protein